MSKYKEPSQCVTPASIAKMKKQGLTKKLAKILVAGLLLSRLITQFIQ